MECVKCGYKESKPLTFFGKALCRVCGFFAPPEIFEFQNYIEETMDWKVLDTFRTYGSLQGNNKKHGMKKTARGGNLVSRAPLGYEVYEGNLVQNEDASRVHSLFKTFLNKEYSLNSMAKRYGLSVNGLKKVLMNRTYLGEIKFDGHIYKGYHKRIISPEIFYAVQRKLKGMLKPRKKFD